MTTDLPADHRAYGVEFLRRVIDSTHDAVLAHRAVRDETGAIVDFEMTLLNQRAEAWLSPASSWVGRRLRTDLPNTLHDGRYQLLYDTVTTGRPQTLETESTFRDGSVHRLKLAAVSDGDDVVVSLRDISQEHDALQALAESEQRYRDLVEHQAELVCRFLPDTTILFVNEAYARYHGTDPDQLVGTLWIDLVAPERRERALEVITSLTPDQVVTDESFALDAEGERRWQQWTTTAAAVENGEITEIQAVGIDITARKQAEVAERERSQMLALVAMISQRFIDIAVEEVDTGIDAALADMGRALDVDRVYVVRYRADGRHLDMTHEWCAPGVESIRDHMAGVDDHAFPRVREHMRAAEPVKIDSVKDLADDWANERTAYLASGVRSTLIMPIIATGRLTGSVGFDVTRSERRFSDQEIAILGSAAASFGHVLARREVESEVRRSERRFRALVAGVPDLLVRIGPDGTILDWRPPASGIDRRSPENVVGRSLAEVFPELLAPVARALGRPADEPPQVDAFDVTWGENSASFEARVTVAGQETIVVVRDVTEQQQLQASLLYQATHDALTGLANRRLFAEHLEEALEHGRNGGAFPAVLFIDLDQFKVLNDSQGHDTGDAVLKAAARRLVRSVRPGDVVARLGGDEFAVLAHRASGTEQAMALAHRVVNSATHPILIEGEDIVITASVGVVIATADSTTASVLRDADAAMYQAKAKGRRRVELFTDDIRQAALARHQVEHELRRALENDELELFYQPLWSLAQRSWVGVEALVRWNHPERGLLAPGAFLSVADDAGLMPQLGDWVIGRACEDMPHWRTGRASELRVWVNLSSDQLMSATLADEVASCLDRHQMGPEALGVEVTETAVVGDIDQARATLTALRSLGVSIALDDFGTGLSSLTHLDTLPLDVVKLDGAFVSGADRPGRQRELIDGIVALVRRLGLVVLAERVESAEEMEALRQLGVDSLQGFYLARPMPVDQLVAFIAKPCPFAVD